MSVSSPVSLPVPSQPVVRRLDARLVIALAAVWLIWGSTYLAMRVAVAGLPPFGMAGTRFVLAGAALLVIVRARGETMPNPRTWLIALPVGALLFSCGNGLVVVAEQTLPSSVAAVVCAMPWDSSSMVGMGGSQARPTSPSRMAAASSS